MFTIKLFIQLTPVICIIEPRFFTREATSAEQKRWEFIKENKIVRKQVNKPLTKKAINKKCFRPSEQEIKEKERKHALDQEKTLSRPRKKGRKKKPNSRPKTEAFGLLKNQDLNL